MSYDGIEIDMLSVGNADCILVSRWEYGVPTRVLVDGGNAGSVSTLKLFLNKRGITSLDYVVCTHPHDDHAGGLREFLNDRSFTIGEVWIHRPQDHVNMLLVEAALNQTHATKRAAIITESLNTVSDIFQLCARRGIATYEPFAGSEIGPLTVVGPSEEYYVELVAQFADSGAITASEQLLSELNAQAAVDAFLESSGTPQSESLETNPQTDPENNSSAILALPHDKGIHLFTGDAGAQALTLAAQAYEIGGCHWMQIPHHGSRRNITEDLIQHFSPSTAYVSAKGSRKHPRRAVVNAFKNTGTNVYSTHYPNGGNLWHHCGNVPDRPDYSSATSLWNKKT